MLRSVAMMNVPIEYKYSIESMFFNRVTGGYRDIVEQAESHRMIFFGVMSRWAYCCERIVQLPRDNLVNSGQTGTRAEQCRVPGIGANNGVAVQIARPIPATVAYMINMAGVVVGGKLVIGGTSRFRKN